jgi:hypothetical protein
MSKVFNLAFQNSANAPDSPGAVTDDNIVYAQTTQSTKTLVVLQSGISRVANNTLATVKVGLGLVSIGTPTRVNGNVWSGGEVVINQEYLTQVYDDTSSRRVQLNWPATSPVVFTTTTTMAAITAAATAADKGYADFVCNLTQTGTAAPTVTVIKNEFATGVTGSYVSVGTYRLAFGGIASTISGGTFTANNGNINVSFVNGNNTAGASAKTYNVFRSSNTEIDITTRDGVTLTDALLTNAMLSIRLYY